MDKVARIIGEMLRDRGCTVSVAESFTSGRVAATLTSVPGASEYFIGGVVAYSEDIKRDVLGESQKLLKEMEWFIIQLLLRWLKAFQK